MTPDDIEELMNKIALLEAQNAYLLAILDDMWKGVRVVEAALSRAHIGAVAMPKKEATIRTLLVKPIQDVVK